MPTITFTLPVAGQDADAGPIATNFNDLQTLLNGGLDGANFVNASLTLGASFALNIGGDTNLYRSAANTLKTDDQFHTAAWFRANVGTSSEADFGTMDGGTTGAGGLRFGGDTNLYRSAANTLKTDDIFVVGYDTGVATTTGLHIYEGATGSKQVFIGAADSGGAGFKMLRVAN